MFQEARVHPGHLVHHLFISSLVKIWEIRVFEFPVKYYSQYKKSKYVEYFLFPTNKITLKEFQYHATGDKNIIKTWLSKSRLLY